MSKKHRIPQMKYDEDGNPVDEDGFQLYKIAFANAGSGTKYETAQELRDKIIEYFEWAHTHNSGTISLTGVAIYCGYKSRQSFYDLEKMHNDFAIVIGKTRELITNFYEETKNAHPTKCIFMMKQLGFRDEQHVLSTKITVTLPEETTEDGEAIEVPPEQLTNKTENDGTE
ncbi:MAG: terminase small subunit [Nitrosomonadaceae bacterium]